MENVKLRYINLRLISKDFFSMEKMFKNKMVNRHKCKSCGEVETYGTYYGNVERQKNLESI